MVLGVDGFEVFVGELEMGLGFVTVGVVVCLFCMCCYKCLNVVPTPYDFSWIWFYTFMGGVGVLL